MRYLFTLLAAGLLATLAFVGQPAGLTLADNVDTNLYGSSDTLVIPELGINAPINTRNVAEDGIMGDPAGKDDVVRYDFPVFPGLGGYPGFGGTTVLAGHVDYRPNLPAVFWTLRQAYIGMPMYYYRADGQVITYIVDWIDKASGDGDIGQSVVATDPEGVVLISCEGSFDPVTRHYNNRTLVHGTRLYQ